MSSVFEVVSSDQGTSARTGILTTRRGPVDTPVFMPVGTQAAVKTLTSQEVADTGTRLILANTYHLMLRPGPEVLHSAGGIHGFMNWSGPVLTDSGGFQVFSLAGRRKVRESGVEFRSHLDGRKLELTPESVIDLQLAYGSDIMMPLDELIGYESSDEAQREAAERTQRWLARSVDHFLDESNGDEGRPLLFGITQGGFDADRRAEQALRTAEQQADGYSIGGLSVGEPKDELFRMLDASLSGLPQDQPRYLMGVGSPEDLWDAVSRGVDMFDCVHPTRVARRGAHFTRDGRVNITVSRFRRQFEPVDPDCLCYACRNYSAAYVHHLFRAGEMLGPRLATIHNIHFFQELMSEMREAIRAGEFTRRHREFVARYVPANQEVAQEQRVRWLESRTGRSEPSKSGR